MFATETSATIDVARGPASVEMAEVDERGAGGTRLGWIPTLSLTTAVGLLLMAGAHAISRAALGIAYSEPLFWLAVIVIVAPIAYRVCSSEPGTAERLTLVLLAALALYLVKVLREPFLFTFPDELVHATNANTVLRTGELFSANTILPATPAYPGLPATTAAVASATGLSVFGAGLLVIGVARVLMTVGLFLLFKEVTKSARIAGIATLAYAGNTNYVFFSAEFAYESLALPLAIVVLYCVARWINRRGDPGRHGLLVCAALVAAMVVMTHHITSYALIAVLIAIALLQTFKDRSRALPLWGLSLLVAVIALLWLKVVAGATADYLGSIFGKTLNSIQRTLNREEGTRTLLSSGSNGPPPWDTTVAYVWALTLAAAVPLGALEVWRRYRRNVIALILAAGGLMYLFALPLRLVSGAWEVASRASEFLFIGAGFLVALSFLQLKGVRRDRLRWAIQALLVTLLIAGGILGWPRDLRTAQTIRIAAGGATLEPRMLTGVRWVGAHLGPGRVFAAGDMDARLLADLAHERVFRGYSPVDIQDIISMPTRRLPKWAIENLAREAHAGFVFLDQRGGRGGTLRSPFFLTASSTSERGFNDPNTYLKFDRQPGTSRIYDGGTIKIYDIRHMRSGNTSLPPPQAQPSSRVTRSGFGGDAVEILRVIGGVVLVLLLPGLALTLALLPRSSLGIPARLLMSIALSITAVTFGSVLMHWLGFRVGLVAVLLMVLISEFLALVVLVAVLLRRKRISVNYRRHLPRVSIRAGLLFALAGIVFAGAVTLSRTPLPVRGVEGNTALWLRPGRTSGLVRVGVSSGEFHRHQYRLFVGGEHGGWSVGKTIELSPGDTWEGTLRVPGRWRGAAVVARLSDAASPHDATRLTTLRPA